MSSLIDTVTVQPLVAADAEALGDFFGVLHSDPETQTFFHPHPLTRSYAAELCRHVAMCRDRYYLAWEGARIIGYVMLRGWDEGYAVPSFGVCIHPDRRQLGLGKKLLQHAIQECIAAGAPQLRLTVYRSNHRAIHVYRKFGFQFSAKNDRELIGLLDLSPYRMPAAAPCL